jgi:O-antigen/teichoic acid export membrane protein
VASAAEHPPRPALAGAFVRQFAGTLCNAAISFGLVLLIARLLGSAEFGHYAAILSFAAVASILIEGGWPGRVYRDAVTSDPRAADMARQTLARGIGHACTVAGITAGIAALLVPGEPAWALALACMGAVATMNLVSARMRAAGRFGLEALWQIGGRIASAACIVVTLSLLSTDVAGVFAAWTCGLLVVIAIGAPAWLTRPTLRGSLQAWPATTTFLLFELAAALLFKGDVALVRWAGADPSTLAQYAACTRLNEAALLLFAAVANVMLRSLRLVHDDPHAFRQLWWRACSAGAALGIACVIGSGVLGSLLMPWLFGAEYAAAGDLLVYTALLLPFALPNLILVQALIACGRERRLAVRCLGVAAFATLALPLGVHLGAGAGAAIAAAASHALLAAACLHALRTQPA